MLKTYRYVVGRVKTKVNLPNTAFAWAYRIYTCQSGNFLSGTWETLLESDVIRLLKQGTTFENVMLSESGALKGSSGTLSRFDSEAMVIISRLANENDVTLGYVVASAKKGKSRVSRVSLESVLGYCDTCLKSERIPFQNAIYRGKGASDAHLKSYEGCPFPTEIVVQHNKYVNTAVVRKNTSILDVTSPSYKADLRKLLDELNENSSKYTPEQRKQLRLGASAGVNISCYANPDISWEKMQIIREALQDGLNVEILTSPDYIVPCDVDALGFMTVLIAGGCNVMPLLNPKYTLGQLKEIHLGFLSFIDINEYADPTIPAAQMAEKRKELTCDWGTIFDKP